ncbi:MAG: MBOAT family O-acyltransferase [Oscillospiraceae bacterium]
MLFNSLNFMIFFPIVVLGYFVVPKKTKNIWLLISSYYFYMCWKPVYALLILFSTFSTFVFAIFIDKTPKAKNKKLFLTLNILLNIGILFYFKYFNFFITTLTGLIPGLSISTNTDLLAVVGISFYTFQSLGYSIDVYRGRVEREKNFLTYALFVSFFPQLVAGPIERSENLLPQFHQTYKFNYSSASNGLKLMAWGFFKKLIIADGAAQIINVVYNEPTKYSGIQLIVATVLFAFQIYGDFSGYSDIAKGAAAVLGYKLMRNFNHPYFATSVPDFWRRWHISLSSWFMDYIYIPLGGSRKGTVRTCINLMITFLLSGLWHGAAATFIIWGGINGLYNVISRLYHDIRIKIKGEIKDNNAKINPFVQLSKVVGTFLLIDFSWIFFRAKSLSDAMYIVKNLFSDIFMAFNPAYFTQAMTKIGFYSNNGIAIVCCIIFMLLVEIYEGRGELTKKLSKCNVIIRWIFYYTIIILILFFGWFGQSQFIYFQF